MSVALLVGRCVLALVFLVAGVSKLADLPGSRRAMVDLGVPERHARYLGAALPLAEIAVAVLLVVGATTSLGAFAALVLLLSFTVVIIGAIARGTQADCHCFGQVHSAPISWRTLARNLMLLAVAVFVLAYRHHHAVSPTAWVTTIGAAGVVAIAGGVLVALLMGFLAWFAIGILRQNGRILVRLEAIEAALAGSGALPAAEQLDGPAAGLPVGSIAPAFALPDLGGDVVALDELVADGLPALLVFSDPGCGPCNALLPDLGRWRAQYGERFAIVVVSRGSADENRAKSEEHQVAPVLLQEDREVTTAYECHGTPGAVLVDTTLRIASPLAQGAEQIEALVRRLAQPLAIIHAGPRPQPDPQVGTPAPVITLGDLDGREVTVPAAMDRATLLLFWNPGCGFCSRMLDDLRAFERNPPKDSPALVVISTGSAEEVRAEGFRSTVLLDGDFAAAGAYGAGGTPMAVLVDTDGRIASPVVGGADAVFELARSHGTAVHRR